ncbi:replication initiation protein [Candidatus Azobacteroides pseudotrichonymphae]|nr:replication initiation protein [Candidatus Azobacteroides pseudotrichonymphae]
MNTNYPEERPGYIPEYAVKKNALLRSIFDLSTNAQRMLAMALARLPKEPKTPEDYRVKFSVSDFFKTFGIERGTNTNRLILNASDECASSVLKIESPDGDELQKFPWLSECTLRKYIVFIPDRETHVSKLNYHEDNAKTVKNPPALYQWDTVVMEFNPKLWETLKEFKGWSTVELNVLGKLQSKYAIRFYEWAMSWKGKAGKDGNPPGKYWFEMRLADIREKLAIPKSKYKAVKEFKRNVIKLPIEELNNADIGVRIDIAPFKRGQGVKLDLIRFDVTLYTPGKEKPANKTTPEELTEDTLIEQYRDIYQPAYDLEKETRIQQSLFAEHPRLLEPLARQAGLNAVRAHIKATQKKRGRPRKARCENEGTP